MDALILPNTRTAAGAILRRGLDLATELEIPPGKRLMGVVVVDKDERVLGIAYRNAKGWEFKGEVSQAVAEGRQGIRARVAVVI